MIREAWAAFLDALLGERCVLCGIRVFVRDAEAHDLMHTGGPR